MAIQDDFSVAANGDVKTIITGKLKVIGDVTRSV